MSAADESVVPGLPFWAALFAICVVSWFLTFYAVLPGYGYLMAVLLYGDSLFLILLGLVGGAALFFLVDLLMPGLVLGAAVVAVRVPEGRGRLFAGGLGLVLRLLSLVHALVLASVVAVILYLKLVVDFGGTWPWLTLAACLLGWSSTLFCWHFLLSCSKREE